jgi:hypothetical protein
MLAFVLVLVSFGAREKERFAVKRMGVRDAFLAV